MEKEKELIKGLINDVLFSRLGSWSSVQGITHSDNKYEVLITIGTECVKFYEIVNEILGQNFLPITTSKLPELYKNLFIHLVEVIEVHLEDMGVGKNLEFDYNFVVCKEGGDHIFIDFNSDDVWKR